MADTYSIDITDASGCTISGFIEVNDPVPPSFTIEYSDISCKGLADGEIEVFATGGSGPFEYSADGTNFQSSPIVESLNSGTYTILLRRFE
ncbi:MAG: hypothetical protein Tsb0034_03370 [Ekhidna sp.]